MKKIFCFFALLIFTFPAFALYNAPLPKTELNQENKSQILLKSNGKNYGQEKTIIYKHKFKGQDYLLVKTLSRKGKIDTEMLTYYLLKNNRISVYSDETKNSKNGKLEETILITFDWEDKKAYYTKTNHKNGKTYTKSYKINAKTISTRGLTFYFQNLINAKKKEDKFKMITEDGKIFNMTAWVFYQPEEVKINKKKIGCYRIKIKPDLGWISMVIPDLNFWYKAESPHTFVRYQGLEKGLGTPEIIQEIIN